MALKVHNVHPSKLEHFLQGGIRGGPTKDSYNRQVVYPDLLLKTLVFTVPLKTVTFVVPPSGETFYTYDDVKSQIETQEPLLLVSRLENVLAISRRVITVGVNLNITGTANSTLGFSTTKINLGVVYALPSGAPPRLIAVNQIGAGHLQVVTDE